MSQFYQGIMDSAMGRALFGPNLEIRRSDWIPESYEVGFPDWRARLRRNLGRTSTARWEPLTYWTPDAIRIGNVVMVSPGVFEGIKRLAGSNPSA